MTAQSADRTQFLSDVLTTAIEGGINYWASIDSVEKIDAPDDVLGWRYDSARIHTLEDGTEFGTMHTIDMETVELGLRRLSESNNYPFPEMREADRTNGAEGDFDAGDADAVIQYGIYEEIVYG